MASRNAQGTQVALVTGASSGIGKAIAARLVQDGLRVFGTSRKGGGGAPGVEMLALDVCSEESVRACVARLLEQTGRLDILVNNAGYLVNGAIEEVPIDELKAQFETNVFGAVRVIQAVLPTLRAQGSGRIINITSLAGVVPLPFWGAYNASKFAIEGISETLRQELRPFGVSVSAVEPGAIKTEFYGANRSAPALPVYAPWRQRFEKRMREFEAAAPGPEVVADTVSRIVRAKRPRLRYRVTKEATLFTVLRAWLPESIFASQLRVGFKLDDEKF